MLFACLNDIVVDYLNKTNSLMRETVITAKWRFWVTGPISDRTSKAIDLIIIMIKYLLLNNQLGKVKSFRQKTNKTVLYQRDDEHKE